jgi:uncharacterized protein
MGHRLADATSPYLRAHAENPVDWYPWGEAAFAAARERDVPVLISIGYATCHWCHVMARESFSDPEVARVLNEGFVSIKVDREEHPDVDASYLAAASAFTRQLGWPLTVFTRPDGRAFYAGTYFPPRAVQGTPSFTQLLEAVGEAWRERRAQLDETAEAVAEALAAASVADTSGPLPTLEALQQAVEVLARDEDRLYGGFGGAPKFPVAPVLGFLAASGDRGRLIARRNLELMGASPLRDRVDGGFFRYATRADWSEPHYERMLTDNSLLLDVAVELAYSEPEADRLRAIAQGVCGFLTGTMQLPSGGFASAQDSESIIDGERNEGGYYHRDAEERAGLEPPALDAKVLTGWNGLAIAALARAGFAFGDDVSIAAARRAADFLIERHIEGAHLVRSSLDGAVSSAAATLEDTGMLAQGLLDLATASGHASYAVVARELVDAAMRAAETGASGSQNSAPFAAPGGADPVLEARGLALPADPAEGATPSAITSCAAAAWGLYLLGAGESYREAAERAMGSVAGIALERPLAFGSALQLMARMASPVVQLVTVVPDASGARAGHVGAGELTAATRRHEASVAAIVTESQARAFADAGFELFEARTSMGGDAAAYRCRTFVCALPVTDAPALDALAADER